VSQQPLNVAEAFTPFAPEELRRLERYAARTRKLFDCPFMRSTNLSFSISGDTEKGTVTTTLSGVDERELSEAAMLFRPLHLQEEKAGFLQVQAMVKRHAYEKGTDEGKRAIENVKSYTAALNTILKNQDLMRLREQKVDDAGVVVSDEDVTPARIFDDFLNGHYFHEDENRISRIGDWIPSEFQRFIFVGTFHNLAGVYTRFAGTPVAILQEPALRS
jgi:hypothetical protein